MAEEVLRDRYIDVRNGRRISQQKPRSLRTLAKEAAPLALGNSPASIADRLREKFRGDQKKYFLDLARYHDDIPETIEFQTLDAVRRLLEPHGIDMKLVEASGGISNKSKKQAKLARRRCEPYVSAGFA